MAKVPYLSDPRAVRNNATAPEWTQRLIGFGGSEQELRNLNLARIANHEGPAVPLSTERPAGSLSAVCGVEPIFQDLEQRLVDEIDKADAVIGCMAWLTNERVLAAMSHKHFVSFLVQKEDWLRPDSDGWCRQKMHALYANLPPSEGRWVAEVGYNSGTDFDLAPVRCVGITGERRSAMPRMHHKFMVFGRIHIDAGSDDFPETQRFEPTSVWTGSFNATQNGTNSFENAVILRSAEMAEIYTQEWRALFGVSEPLNWSSEWVQPEYRFGT